ncbi:MAG: hypothetical protein ABI262_15325 [Microcoleus sp.]|jgi:hypothetical protein
MSAIGGYYELLPRYIYDRGGEILAAKTYKFSHVVLGLGLV